MTLVVDASAVIEVLVGGPHASRVADALGRDRDACAPELMSIETLHAVRRLVRAGRLRPARGAQALSDLRDLPVRSFPHRDLLGRVWALRDRLSAYDATYLALAEALDATLVTADRGLARAAGDLVPVIYE